MNLLKLRGAAWIIILNLILIVILSIVLFRNESNIYDSFMDIPQMINPLAKLPENNTSSNEAAAANNNYASLLLFIQQNPDKSAKFITDIRDKFFKSSCEVKDMIDFANIAQLPGGMPFSS